jgi:hypothetical protein
MLLQYRDDLLFAEPASFHSVRLLRVGLYSKSVTFQGSTSEPERPKVDAKILDFVQTNTFTGADFILRKDGACRLSPQLARVVATIVG